MQYMLMCCFDESCLEQLIRRAERPDHARLWRLGTGTRRHRPLPRRGKTGAGAVCEDGAHEKRQDRLTDGPFAETKEQFGGYHLIDCKDLNEAMSIAASMPTLAAGGAVEVRCIAESEC